MLVPHDILGKFASDLLEAGGFTKEEADIAANSLILSNLMGYDSHGIVRVREYNESLTSGDAASKVDLISLNETVNSLQADAQLGLGQVQMQRFVDRLMSKADGQGIVSGTLMNCGHTGRIGEWAERIADKGYAAFVAVNDNGTFFLVSPFGGKEARTSTNPIAFAIPLKDGKHFSIDLSTSATAAGKVRLAHMEGKALPEGLLQDHDGNPTTNASCLFEEPKGSILPFGGYKGFAISMMIDCLVAGLSGGFTPPAPQGAKPTNNVMVCIWNPKFFAGLEHMQDEAEKYLAYVRSTTPIDPLDPVRVPGDRAKAVYQDRMEKGVPVEKNLWDALMKYAGKLGVTVPDALKA